MKTFKKVITFLFILQLVIISGCSGQRSLAEPETPTASEAPKLTATPAPVISKEPSPTPIVTVNSNPTLQPTGEPPKISAPPKKYLFKICSEKDNIDDAAFEIGTIRANQFMEWQNNEYVKNGSDQRMDGLPRVEVCEKNQYDNLIKGGTLWTFALCFELKPRFPEKWTPNLALEGLMEDGWVSYEGFNLLIYQDNNTPASPYYLADTILIDEFLAFPNDPERATMEILLTNRIKKRIPQLKDLLK